VLALWSDRDRQRAAAALVRVGLWLDHPEGWQFHDWQQHQPSREKVLGERERKAQNKRDSRNNGKGGHQHVTAPVTGGVTAPVTGDRSGSHHGPDPTRPDPTRIQSLATLASERAGERGPTPAGIVEGALSTAIGAAGGRLTTRSGDAQHFVEAAGAIKASDPRPLRDAAAEWCADFVAEFRVRSPKNLASYAQSRAANGGARLAPAPAYGKPSGWQPPADHAAFTQTEITDDLFRKESA
jgi:hypothetical protein